MISKEKALYQVKLILDYLPKEEYSLISQETIDYIEDNFEYDENFTINPSIPLENQKIDDKAFEILDRIIKETEKNKQDESSIYVKEENQEIDMKTENIRLKNIIKSLEKENMKIPKVKSLLEEYKIALKQRDNEILNLKEKNKQLYDSLHKIPKILRKIFIKETKFKLLNQ